VYVLIFVLQSASAAFTPTFQATIPDILPDEREYPGAFLSRLAYDLESVISPMLAALLLTVVSFTACSRARWWASWRSAAMVGTVVLPLAARGPKRSIYERTTKGMRIFLRTPQLRGLLALNLTIAAASAMVIVTPWYWCNPSSRCPRALPPWRDGLRRWLDGGRPDAAQLLERLDDRKAMLAGGAVLVAGLILGTFVSSYPALILLWLVLGAGYSGHRHRPDAFCGARPQPRSTCAVRRPVRPFTRLLADHLPARGMVGGKRQPDGFVHRTESGCRRSLAGEQADLAPGV
jgi:MFS family permease